jgi:hypothetical protein
LLTGALLLTSGCTYNKATTLKGPSQKSVLVVPVKGPAIQLLYQHTSVAVFGGLLGTSIEGAASETFRAELAQRLNQHTTNLQPDRILAEECAKLLRTCDRVAFRDVTVSPETLELEETKALLQDEPRPFVSDPTYGMQVFWLHRKWLKSPPRGHYGLAPDAAQQTLVMETVLSTSTLNLGKKLELMALFRLADPSSGQILGSTRFVIGTSEITPIKDTIDVEELERGFRVASQKASAEALKYLKLK